MNRREFMAVRGGSAQADRPCGGSSTSRSSMRGCSVLALLFTAGILWAMTASAQTTERSVEEASRRSPTLITAVVRSGGGYIEIQIT
jgi:hypothetical protein